MNLLNLIKVFNAIPPTAIKDNTAFTSYVIDKAEDVPHDARGVLFLVALGATDVAMAVLKVMQSTVESNATTLGGSPALVKDTASKPGAGADNGLVAIYVPMSLWTERYLQLQATAGNGTNGTYLAAVAIFDRPGVTDATAEALGLLTLDVA